MSNMTREDIMDILQALKTGAHSQGIALQTLVDLCNIALGKATRTRKKHFHSNLFIKSTKSKSGFAGVTAFTKNGVIRFRASITYEGDSMHLGEYSTAENAAKVYLRAHNEFLAKGLRLPTRRWEIAQWRKDHSEL